MHPGGLPHKRGTGIVARKVSSQDKPGFRDSEGERGREREVLKTYVATSLSQTLEIVKSSGERNEASSRREHLSKNHTRHR